MKRDEEGKSLRRRRRERCDDSSSSSDEDRRRRRHREDHKRKKKKHKRKRYSSDDENESFRKKHRKSKKKRKSKERESSPPTTCMGAAEESPVAFAASKESEPIRPPSPPRVSERAQRMVPMSREQYEVQQAVIHEVYDEETGRYRLVRGTGEIVERIVSRSDHERINHQATHGDGSSYSRHIFSAAQKR